MLVLDLIPKDGQFQITDTLVEEYRSAFPGVDVELELRRACQWCRDNPTRRKTRSGARRFLGAWLGRVQDRQGSGIAMQVRQQRRTWIDAQKEEMANVIGGGEATADHDHPWRPPRLLPAKGQ